MNTQDITQDQITEARDWASDCLGMVAETVTINRALKYISANYPGGWDAFVAEVCVTAPVPAAPAEYKHCDRCGGPHPGRLVQVDGKREALCFTCWNPIRQDCKLLDWINLHGKLQFGNR